MYGMEDEEMRIYPPLKALRESEIDSDSSHEICSVILHINTNKVPIKLLEAIDPIVFKKFNDLKYEQGKLEKKTYKKLIQYAQNKDLKDFELVDKLAQKEYAYDIVNNIISESIEQALEERDQQYKDAQQELHEKVHKRTVAAITGSFSLVSALITGFFTWLAAQ